MQISNYLWWRDVSLKHIFWLFVLNIFNKGSIWKIVLVQFIKYNWLHKLCQDFPEKLKKKQSNWRLTLQMPRLVFSRQMQEMPQHKGILPCPTMQQEQRTASQNWHIICLAAVCSSSAAWSSCIPKAFGSFSEALQPDTLNLGTKVVL